jgi:flagellar protein FlgJ
MKPLAGASSALAAAGDLAADSRSLDRLRREAGRDPRQAIAGAARQFEAMFLQMVLKSMREATPKSGLLESSAGELYTGMLDQQLATSMAGRAGLAEMIERQLTRHLSPAAGSPDGATAAGEAGPAARKSSSSTSLRPLAAVVSQNVAAAVTPAVPAAVRGAMSRTFPAAPDEADMARAPAAAPIGAASTAIGGATAASVFVNRMWDHALAAQRATGLPAKFIIGQAALESGWGSREISGADGRRSFNLFGIKATPGWKGRIVEALTTEYENGVAVRRTEKFRAYDSYGEAFRDWARLLADHPRYAEVRAQADAAGFARALQRAGYATDPDYGAKLRRVIETSQALRGLG